MHIKQERKQSVSERKANGKAVEKRGRTMERNSAPGKQKGKGKDRLRETPSRTPTPPPAVTWRGTTRHAYTDEDKEFLIRYTKYRLKEDPHLKKLDICVELARKVSLILPSCVQSV